jgi:hypothetical protein
MHAEPSYHAWKTHSLPTAWPACISPGSPAKRGNLISWLLPSFLLKRRMSLPAHQTRFPSPSAEFPPSYSIRSSPPNFGPFFPNLFTLHHTFCFRCPIFLSPSFIPEELAITQPSLDFCVHIEDQRLLLRQQPT